MLGNFSFGDYFKKEAITWAWDFLTGELAIKEKDLRVSVYKDDDQAYNIWHDNIKIPSTKIRKLSDKENFWPSEAKTKGPNGPCGPCSEIFFDQGKSVGCLRHDCAPGCSCGRFLEVWNLVFTQFNRLDIGKLEPLPKKNIDTGMGLERLAAVMQGVANNFQTDLFSPIVQEISNCSKLSGQADPNNLSLVYAIADHIRAVTFAIYDGVLPSNEARGYVVRKIIRKSALCLKALGIRQPFLHKLVPIVAGIMQEPYPLLKERRENISEVILAEEKSFLSTLDSSEELLKEKFSEFFKRQDAQKAGKVAFYLYDTYGIPLELTAGWLEKHGISISQEAFRQQLEDQKVRSKLQSTMKGDVFKLGQVNFGLRQTKFLGYKAYSLKAKILSIIRDEVKLKKINPGEEATIILEATPFYAQAGGQVGDTGCLIKGKGVFEVYDTQRVGKVILHLGRLKSGSLKDNDTVLAKVDAQRRLSIARNHTATHLLQAALRRVLGTHVKQQGSLVSEDRLRFDFTHFKDITYEQLDRIEELVNESILQNYPVEAKEKGILEAKKSGALAFFQEKYADRVRVVTIDKISQELCGGTHLETTSQIGLFKITQEGSVSSGTRRIEAVTGFFAYHKIKEEESILTDSCASLKVPPDKLNLELEKMSIRIRELEKELSQKRLGALQGSLDALIGNAPIINGVRVVTNFTPGLDMDTLRKTVDYIKERQGNEDTFIGLATSNEQGNTMLVFGATAGLVAKGIDASGLVKELAVDIGGSGGGRKDFAQAGGNKPQNIETVFGKLKKILEQKPL
jgi:alanyl-tRNA synthetase